MARGRQERAPEFRAPRIHAGTRSLGITPQHRCRAGLHPPLAHYLATHVATHAGRGPPFHRPTPVSHLSRLRLAAGSFVASTDTAVHKPSSPFWMARTKASPVCRRSRSRRRPLSASRRGRSMAAAAAGAVARPISCAPPRASAPRGALGTAPSRRAPRAGWACARGRAARRRAR